MEPLTLKIYDDDGMLVKKIERNPKEVDDGRNCTGGNCCYTNDFRCYHPNERAPKCSRRY